jgi:alanyl-tRNA synthetase
MITQRLYYEDAYRVQFEAELLRTSPGQDGATGVILDRTCFYPNSGGQPSDTGTLDGQRVLRVDEQGKDIVHWVEQVPDGPRVKGSVDWPRRFDHMQQHSGQHILSQAFLKILKAQTVSFHLSDESSTIDVSRATLQAEEADAVERLANEVVLSDRQVLARFVAPDQLKTLELRKGPVVQTDIRIVQVEGFDATPCGGTHVSRTGEVGPIAIRRWERRGQETRVEFLCGWRALRDYQWKTRAINELALGFSVKDRELPEAVTRLTEEANDDRRELQRARERLLEAEASQIAAEAEADGNIHVALRAFDDRDAKQVSKLAALVAQRPKTVALLGVAGAKGRLFFARSSDLSLDVARLLNETCREFGGGGGGQADAAQGGGFPGPRVRDALDWARRRLTSS